MPIRIFASKRKGLPLMIFTGTVKEAIRLSQDEIAAAFKRANAAAARESGFLEKVTNFKGEMTAHLQRLRQQFLFHGKKPANYLLLCDTPLGWVYLNARFFGGSVLIHQAPMLHGVTGRKNDVFVELKQILEQGFRSYSKSENVYVGGRRKTGDMGKESRIKKTAGCAYTIELMSKVNPDYSRVSHDNFGVGYVPAAAPNEVLRINIGVPYYTTDEKLARLKEFYRKEFGKYHVPLSFYKLPYRRL